MGENTMTKSAIAEKEPQASRALGRQKSIVSEIESILETLENRLSPVLTPVGEKAGENQEATPQPMVSPIVSMLNDNSDRLDLVIGKIRMILSGLEI